MNEEEGKQVEENKEVKNSKTNNETSNTKDKKAENNVALLAIEATSISLVGVGAIWVFVKKIKNQE